MPELHIPFCRQRKRHRYKSSVCGGNAAEFAKEVEKIGKGLADPQLVKLFAENSAMALDWLTDHGVVFTPQPNSAFRLKRMHGCDKHTGAQYVDVLFQNAKKIGVDIKLNTK